MKIWHVIYVYQGESPLKQRQDLFFQSLEQADLTDVQMVGGVSAPWSSPGWLTEPITRDSTNLGDTRRKPYIKDLFDLAASKAAPEDWIFFTNGDCSVVPTLYQELRSLRATAVEYQRLDVENEPQTLDELFQNPHSPYLPGIDGLALRAGFYQKYRDCLPDFIIGEPWWDPAYSWILRELVPVRRLSGRLYHPKHDQLWDVAEPGPAGHHNYNLMKRALQLGHVKELCLFDRPETTDTAIITSLFGDCSLRNEAAIKGLQGQLRQDLYCDHYVVELLQNNGKSLLPEELLEKVVHVPIVGDDHNAGLFQKEALFNIGWRLASEKGAYKYFIFTDADIYSEDNSWFRQIRYRLRDQPTRLVHGYRVVQDTKDPAFSFSSLGSLYSFQFQTDLPINPGLCWGIHHRMLEMGNGFNPYCVECAGDSALVEEYLNQPGREYETSLYEWPWYSEIRRELSHCAVLDAVPVDIHHCHHGPAKERHYQEVRMALSKMGSLLEMVKLDKKGLLAWNESASAHRELLARRAEMTSYQEVDRLLAAHGFSTKLEPTRHPTPRKKPIPDWPSERPAVLQEANAEDAESERQDRYPVFCLRQLNRRGYHASWCDNVARVDDTNHIPLISCGENCRLRLEGLEGVSYIIGLVALQPNWVPVDVSSFDVLQLSLLTEGEVGDVVIQLVTQDEEGVERESAEIKLRERGLEAGRESTFQLALERFEGPSEFNLKRVRTVKLLGYGSFTLDAFDIFFATLPSR